MKTKSPRPHPPEANDSPYRVEVERIPVEVQGWPRSGGRQSSTADIELLARWMDSVFEIPGLRWRFGLDALLGLLPGFGDTATSIVSLYILHAAGRRGVSRLTMSRMAMNIGIDYVVGAIPFVGDVFDIYWKANQKNVELLRRESLAGPADARRMRVGDWLFFLGLAAILVTLLVGSVTIAWFVIGWLGSKLFSGG
jgi:hypothetical protein